MRSRDEVQRGKTPHLVSSALVALTACTFPYVGIDDAVGSTTSGGAITTVGASGIGGATTTTTDGATTTGDGGATGVPVALGSAGDYAILSETGITNVPPSMINGNLGVSPIAVTAITGFVLTPDGSGTFSTSLQVAGKVYAASHTEPTPSKLIVAISDMQVAFGEAAARTPDVSELGDGDIGGMTVAPGVYRWSSALSIPTSVSLVGSATDVWVFQIAQTLHMTGAAQVALSGGAVPENVFWQVSGLVDIGAASHLEGVVLAKTSIAMHTGASLHGRLLAQTAVTFETSVVAEP